MQIEIQAPMENNEHIASVVPAVSQGGQTFDLPELITDFCNWYRGCLADQKSTAEYQSSVRIFPGTFRAIDCS